MSPSSKRLSVHKEICIKRRLLVPLVPFDLCLTLYEMCSSYLEASCTSYSGCATTGMHSGLTLHDARIPFLLVAAMSLNGDHGCLFSVQAISEPSDLRHRITTRDPRYWLITKRFAYVVFKHVNKS